MRRRTLVLGVIVLVAAAVGACAGSRAPSTKLRASGRHGVAGGIVGVMFDGPVFAADVNLGRQLDAAVASGVESLRVAVNWSALQPYEAPSDVPAPQRGQFQNLGGVPTNVSYLDRIVGAAAARGLSLLPVVEFAPRWDAQQPRNPASPPKSTTPYAAFLAALVGRYGPHGSFWATHPSLPSVPIRMWQIWNEPNFVSYWSKQPFAPSYVRLLAASRAALKAADPGAKVVLAGFADSSWQYLAELYHLPGAKHLFDLVAIHPYTAQPAGVITILARARAVMNRYGDRSKPILATEITWPSSEGKAPPQFGVSTTERTQAQRLEQLMPLLKSNRRRLGLLGFYWYTWMGNESARTAPYAFDYAGLLKYVAGTVTPKPALAVFRHWALSIEGCRRKVTSISCAS